MFSYFELPEAFFENDIVIRDCTGKLNLCSLPSSHTCTLQPNVALNTEELPADHVCLVRDGIAKVQGPNKLFYFLETDDIFFSSALQSIAATLESEFVSAIDCYPLSAVTESLLNNSESIAAFATLQQCLLSQLHILYNLATTQKIDVEPVTKTYSPGEVIIIQNTTPTEVFTLLAGEADVYLGETVVGEILVGEIFGAMSAASNFDRSASVVARNHCVTLSLPKENFLGLARTHPETLFKLVENMSRIIVSLNEQLAEKSL